MKCIICKIELYRKDFKIKQYSSFKCNNCKSILTIPWGHPNLEKEDKDTNYNYE